MPIELTPTTPDWHEQIDAAATGEHFRLSEGKFTLTRPLVVSAPGVRISGAGRGVTTAVTGKETLLHKDYAGPAVAFVPKHASTLSPVIKRDGRPWMRLGLCSEVPYSVPLQDSGVCSFRDGRTVILELFVDALKADNLGIGVPLWVAGNQNRYGYEEWKYEHAETGFGIYQRWTWGLYFIQQAGGIVLRFMVPRPENPLDLPHLVDSAPLPVNAAGETGRHHVVAVFQADGPRRGLELYVDGVRYLGATGASLSPMSLDLMDDCVLGVQPESWMGSWPPPKASGFMRGATLRVGAALPAEAGFAPPGLDDDPLAHDAAATLMTLGPDRFHLGVAWGKTGSRRNLFVVPRGAVLRSPQTANGAVLSDVLILDQHQTPAGAFGAGEGVLVLGTHDVRLTRLNVVGPSIGIRFDNNAWVNAVDDVHVTTSRGFGILCSDKSGLNHFTNIRITGTNIQFCTLTSHGVSLRRAYLQIENNTQYAIFAVTPNSGDPGCVHVESVNITQEVPAPDLRAVVFAEGIPSLDFQACSLEVFASSAAAILEVGPHSVLSRIVFRNCTLKRPEAAASLVRVLRVNPATVAKVKLAFEHSILTPGSIALLVTPDRETQLGPYPALVDWVETTTT